MSDNAQTAVVLENGVTYQTILTAPQDGFYRVDIRYAHTNWDMWIRIDIVGEAGDTLTYMPPLPKYDTSTPLLLHLFKGQNALTVSRCCGQTLTIYDMVISPEPPRLQPTVTPSCDRFYIDAPRTRHLSVVSYTGAPVAVTDGDVSLPFELGAYDLYRPTNSLEREEPLTYHHLFLHPSALNGLAPGTHELQIHLPGGATLPYTLCVESTASPYDLAIVSLDVNHGNATLLRLPNGKTLLIDTGTVTSGQEVILPYLHAHGIAPDYCLITHFHEDHIGSLDELLARYPLPMPDKAEAAQHLRTSADERAAYLSHFRYLDSTMLCRYDRLDRIWDLGGVEITALNSRFDPTGDPISSSPIPDENSTSVSLLVRYNGFGYYHGADNYAPAQRRNLEDFTAWGRLDELECHYMQANHHFHGDVSREMIRAVNPVAVLVPGNQAVYARSAFMVDYMQEIVQTDYPRKRLQDTFVSYSSSTVTVFVNSGDDWHYETT